MAGREVTLGGLLVVFACTAGLGAWGFFSSGPMVGVLGALGGALVGFAAHFLMRAISVHRSLEDAPAPQVLSLPPDQALNVLSAMVNRDSGRANLASEVLSSLAAISERAEADLPSAIVEAEELRRRFPRSPAVPAELARLHRKRDASETAAACASQAITLALNGGMNAVAARTFAELGAERERELLELGTREWEALARVLAVRDDADGAAWARARGATAQEKAPGPEPDA